MTRPCLSGVWGSNSSEFCESCEWNWWSSSANDNPTNMFESVRPLPTAEAGAVAEHLSVENEVGAVAGHTQALLALGAFCINRCRFHCSFLWCCSCYRVLTIFSTSSHGTYLSCPSGVYIVVKQLCYQLFSDRTAAMAARFCSQSSPVRVASSTVMAGMPILASHPSASPVTG